uniref:EEF1A lysine methyltransferase 4 n=1 Tax=Ornithodoros turicata TaxID=34597 RepID=A0A2R5LBB5_9ACAR
MEGKSELPDRNSGYADITYWNTRYRLEDTYDWLLSYESYSHLLKQHVKKSDRILMLGCGNSLLSELMYKDGYKDVENIDYSEVVIKKMALHCDTCASMKWHIMDATNLLFEDGRFDVVIEKATIDALLVNEKDPWNVSESAKTLVHTVLTEVSRVLRHGGRFISITFAQPHFRGPMYISQVLNWSLQTFNFGTTFHYFFYLMKKGETAEDDVFPAYQLPVLRPRDTSLRTSTCSEPETVDFLFKIVDS